MLRNYLKIALRQLWRNRLFTALNVLGLTVGLAVSTFIALYVWHEFHYDRFQPLADRTYRIMSVAKYGGDDVFFPGLHESFAQLVTRQIPEVDEAVRLSDGFNTMLQSDDNHRFKVEDIGFADARFLDVMDLSLQYGDTKTALSEPGRIVLSRQTANRLFKEQNPVGKTLIYDKHFPLTVSGVLDDLPTNSIVQFNGLVSLNSMSALGAKQQEMYKSYGIFTTFLVLHPGANPGLVERKLQAVKGGFEFGDIKAKHIIEPLPSLHLDSKSGSKDSRQLLYVLLTVSLVILVLAVVNYVSLTTARATQRAREVGIRKAVGGQRHELIGQFFLESFLTTTLAFVCSLAVLQVLFPWANQALDLNMDKRVLIQGPYWVLIGSLWLGCSLLSGAYPALLLSGFRPATVLKGSVSSRHSGAGLRRVFTTVQFAVCVGLLICSLVLFAQMRFMQTKNLGIDRAQIISIALDGEAVPQFAALRDAMRQWAGPGNVAVTNARLFTNNITTMFTETVKGKKQLMLKYLTVDKSFFSMMGVRWQHQPVGWETGPVTKPLTVYNEAVLKEIGIQGNPLQQAAPFAYTPPVSGVVANFHLSSLHDSAPFIQMNVVSDTSRAFLADGGYLLVRLPAQTNVPNALAKLKAIYEQNQSTVPFDYYFLNDAYDKLYAKETRLARLFNSFTALTLLVACLGLLGLMTFSVEARTKEIGVRKVLGASVGNIVTLLSKDFLKLILLAVVIASPVAWWTMNKWLADFAYKIDIEWWVFALAGGLAVGIALLTVSFQSIRAALQNPVRSLRNE